MVATREAGRHRGMSWREVCEHPVLRDLAGFHIDTDELGRVLMTPVGTGHGVLQAAIGRRMAGTCPLSPGCRSKTRSGAYWYSVSAIA